MFRIIPDGEHFREHALLRDGESVLLRLAGEDDLPALAALLARVSRETLAMRFMGGVSEVPRRFVEQLCHGRDLSDRACLLALTGEGPDADIVGFGDYSRVGPGSTAEVAFLVDDPFQGRGVSTLLLERLAGLAAGAGLAAFSAEVLYDNQAMLGVFRSSGFEVRRALDGGSWHIELPVGGAAALRERADLRERIAVAASVARLVRPRKVAVVGASRDRASLGGLIFRNILNGDFKGTVWPVNHHAQSVQGVHAYPTAADLPEEPDLLVVAVPAPEVQAVAEAGLKRGAHGLVVITSGFAETGPDGVAAQEKLLSTVRTHGARLVGPNCLGLLNTDPEVHLNASLAPALPPPGRVGFFSHSAALGIVILQEAAERGLGFSTFVSAGNRADVSGNDLLQYWEEDPSTDLAMLYLETFGNPRRFSRVARRVTARKPVLCVKSARSRAGRSVAREHIAAAPMGEAEVQMLFRQAGVIRVQTLEELFDAAVLLAHQPLPAGPRVAILGNSGGVVTITADACEAHGLEVVRTGSRRLGALSQPEDYRRAVQEDLEAPDVDALIALYMCLGECDPELIGRAIRRGVVSAARRTGTAKPVLLCLMGAAGAVEVATGGGRQRQAAVFPSYRFPEAAARALAHAVVYSAYRAAPAGRLVWHEDVDAAGARAEVETALAADGAAITFEHAQAVGFLAHFGIAAADEAAGGVPLTVRSDPDFGPLVLLRPDSGPPRLRITPLTDREARTLAADAGLAAEGGVPELLERVSQMVEEIPWLEALEAGLELPGSGAAPRLTRPRLRFVRGGGGR